MRSGGADFVLRLSERLAERGVDVRVVTSAIKDVTPSKKYTVLPIIGEWGWLDLFRLRRIARSFRPDVVEIHFAGGIYNHHPMITCLPFLLRKWLSSVRIVLHIEYPEPVQKKRLRSPTRLIREILMLWGGRSGTDYGYGTLLRDSDAIIILCDTHREVLVREFAQVRDKCVTITQPPTIKMSKEDEGTRAKSRKKLDQPDGAPLLVYYGYIYPNKGIETLLESFRLVAHTFRDARLLMLGGANQVVLRATNRPNYLQELRQLAKESDIAEKVIWTDYFPTDSDEPSSLLRAADVCVLPFDDGISMHRSTFGVVASHYLPVVTTRGQALEEPFIDRANVMLCPPKDAQALARAVIELLEDTDLQERLRDGTRELAKEYFSWDNCIAQRMALLRG